MKEYVVGFRDNTESIVNADEVIANLSLNIVAFKVEGRVVGVFYDISEFCERPLIKEFEQGSDNAA